MGFSFDAKRTVTVAPGVDAQVEIKGGKSTSIGLGAGVAGVAVDYDPQDGTVKVSGAFGGVIGSLEVSGSNIKGSIGIGGILGLGAHVKGGYVYSHDLNWDSSTIEGQVKGYLEGSPIIGKIQGALIKELYNEDVELTDPYDLNLPHIETTSPFSFGGVPVVDIAGNLESLGGEGTGSVGGYGGLNANQGTNIGLDNSQLGYGSQTPGRNVDNGGVGRSKPILIDLDGDGVEIAPVDQNFTLFDWDDDGWRERTAWVGADDGFLVFDESNDGAITAAREVALAQWAALAGNTDSLTDLEALALYFDVNGDGVLNTQDDVFSAGDALVEAGVVNVGDSVWDSLKIWQDLDADGEVGEGEFKTLAQWNITEIGLSYSNEEMLLLSDSSSVSGFIDVTQIDENGEAQTILGADVALAHDENGMTIDEAADGTRTYDFEVGQTPPRRRSLPHIRGIGDGVGTVRVAAAGRNDSPSGRRSTGAGLVERFVRQTADQRMAA